MGLLVVTDLDVVAFGRGYAEDSDDESIVLPKNGFPTYIHWEFRRRVRIMMRDSVIQDEPEMIFNGDSATVDVAERWRLAALDMP